MQTWAAKIAVEQQHPITLLRERDSVIRAGETLAFVRQRAGKERNLSLAFRSQKRKGRPQITERFRGRTFGHVGNDTIGRRALTVLPAARRFVFFFRLRYGSKDRQAECCLGLIDCLDRAVDRVRAENEGESGRQTAEQSQDERFARARANWRPRQRRMLHHTDRGHLYVFCYISLFDLTENAFVKGAIGFGLACELLIPNRRLV